MPSSVNSRRSLRSAFSAAVLGGFVWAVGPSDQSLEPSRSYHPNDVQAEFLRLAAARYDYVALGDTDHRRAEVNMFALSPESVGALAAGGDRYVFTEAGPWAQAYIEKIPTVPVGQEDSFRKRWSDGNMWMCSGPTADRMNDNFEASVRANPHVMFVGSDQRQDRQSVASDPQKSLSFILTVGMPLMLYEGLYGCVDVKAFYPAAIYTLISGNDFIDVLTDDRFTRDYIRTRAPEGGTIFFGAGHFENKSGTLRTLLQEDGFSVANINVYVDGMPLLPIRFHAMTPMLICIPSMRAMSITAFTPTRRRCKTCWTRQSRT